nr:uncharacterized protein LOC101260451 isoform X2 [Solanum lycopersicum]
MSNEAPAKPPCDTPEHDSAGVNGFDINNDTSSTALAKGLSTIISSLIREFDDSAAATSRSQDQLSSTLDRLTGGLPKQMWLQCIKLFNGLVEMSIRCRHTIVMLEKSPGLGRVCVLGGNSCICNFVCTF